MYILFHVVIACILNQFKGQLLLNVDLSVTIFMNLKLKKETIHPLSYQML
jgi:hypothetical protein